VPIFVAVGTLRKITTIVRVRDFANVNPLEGKITLVISDETYLAPMLKIFLGEIRERPRRTAGPFHRDALRCQRWHREIEDLVVAEPERAVFRDLIYAFR